MDKNYFRTRWQSFKQRVNKENYLSNCRQKNRNRIFLLGGLIIFGGILYLWQINSLATTGYKINALEDQAAGVKEQNKKLLVQITELRSTSRLEQKIAELKMVSVARVEYLQSNGSSVAMNR